jgi:hypothetical protein
LTNLNQKGEVIKQKKQDKVKWERSYKKKKKEKNLKKRKHSEPNEWKTESSGQWIDTNTEDILEALNEVSDSVK